MVSNLRVSLQKRVVFAKIACPAVSKSNCGYQMDRPPTEPNRLKAEDFRRLGVRPQEWRATIIRRAAARSARELAERQLRVPTETTERALSDVAVSTYRVLDPRRRNDSGERVSIGRILPLALTAASQAHFCDGRPDRQVAETLASDVSSQAGEPSLAPATGDSVPGVAAKEPMGFKPLADVPELLASAEAILQTTPIVTAESSLPETAFDPDNLIARRLESDSLLEVRPLQSFFDSVRRRVIRPSFVVSVLGLIIAATVWLGRTRPTDLVANEAEPIRTPARCDRIIPRERSRRRRYRCFGVERVGETEH